MDKETLEQRDQLQQQGQQVLKVGKVILDPQDRRVVLATLDQLVLPEPMVQQDRKGHKV